MAGLELYVDEVSWFGDILPFSGLFDHLMQFSLCLCVRCVCVLVLCRFYIPCHLS